MNLNIIINKLFWNVYESKNAESIANISIKPFENISNSFADARINESYNKANTKWLHHQKIDLIKEPVIIESEQLYCIRGLKNIISQSIKDPNVRPSVKNYIKARISNTVVNFEKCIIFDGEYGLNYFHFFSDVINKIWLLDQYKIDKSLPILISSKLFNRPYFQYLYQLPEIKKLNWKVLEEGTLAKSNNVYIIKPMPYDASLWYKTKSLILQGRKNVSSDNIFINRSTKMGRYISNFDEIIPILEKYSIVIIEPGEHTFEEQVQIFSNAKNIVALHGAGLTNMVFSDTANLSLLEVNPSDRISSHYYWLAKSLGIKYYDSILGGDLTSQDRSGNFILDPVKFEKALLQMLN